MNPHALILNLNGGCRPYLLSGKVLLLGSIFLKTFYFYHHLIDLIFIIIFLFLQCFHLFVDYSCIKYGGINLALFIFILSYHLNFILLLFLFFDLNKNIFCQVGCKIF